MPEIKLGTALLFLIPGLLAYCALFGIFATRSQLSVAPIPAAPNSIKTLAIILIASVVTHGATALINAAGLWLCARGICVARLPYGYHDIYGTISRLSRNGPADAFEVSFLVAGAVAQGLAAYLAIRLWLARCAAKDNLPDWLYGWSTDIANKVDDEDRLLIAYVLSTKDIGDRSVVYVGAVRDLALQADGSVARIVLRECERYVVGVDTSWSELDLPPLSLFPLMSIDAANIRNIAFETVPVAPPE